MASNDKPEEHPEAARAPRPQGRLRSAWQVFLGERQVPAQIAWEWAEYQSMFNDLLTRYSATLARAAKAEKKRIADLSAALDQPIQPLQSPVRNHGSKQELRHRAAAYLRGEGNRLDPYSQPQDEP